MLFHCTLEKRTHPLGRPSPMWVPELAAYVIFVQRKGHSCLQMASVPSHGTWPVKGSEDWVSFILALVS